MIAILGPPPADFLDRSENCLRYWDSNGLWEHFFSTSMTATMGMEPSAADIFCPGNWRGLVPIPEISLEQREPRLEGEDKAEFLQFIRRMVRWMPEERPTTEEVIFDPWLMEGLFED
jgi:serine/threonine-protein kinase SRPK3